MCPIESCIYRDVIRRCALAGGGLSLEEGLESPSSLQSSSLLSLLVWQPRMSALSVLLQSLCLCASSSPAKMGSSPSGVSALSSVRCLFFRASGLTSPFQSGISSDTGSCECCHRRCWCCESTCALPCSGPKALL